jgi:hypothetical protein
MDPENNLPQIFYDMLDKADVTDKLTSDIIATYCEGIQEDESFLPDLLAVIGPEAFETMVKYHGGQTFHVPRAEEILSKVKKDG